MLVLLYNWWNINRLYEKTQEQEEHQLLLPERLSTFFSSVLMESQALILPLAW